MVTSDEAAQALDGVESIRRSLGQLETRDYRTDIRVTTPEDVEPEWLMAAGRFHDDAPMTAAGLVALIDLIGMELHAVLFVAEDGAIRFRALDDRLNEPRAPTLAAILRRPAPGATSTSNGADASAQAGERRGG